MNSRAPSGDDLRRIGVSTSMKSQERRDISRIKNLIWIKWEYHDHEVHSGRYGILGCVF